MKIKFYLLLIPVLIIFLFSCKSEREKKVETINKESLDVFSRALLDIKIYNEKMNPDSLTNEYSKISSRNPELGLEFAKRLRDGVNIIKEFNKTKLDSIDKAILANNVRKDNIEQKQWENSKPGKIQKKHPSWTREDCKRIADHQIWIGMSLDMLKYERGTPNRANPSNYGGGTKWQWCWYDYIPSCFYGGADGIINSYN